LLIHLEVDPAKNEHPLPPSPRAGEPLDVERVQPWQAFFRKVVFAGLEQRGLIERANMEMGLSDLRKAFASQG
jgi:hypothetical protein